MTKTTTKTQGRARPNAAPRRTRGTLRSDALLAKAIARELFTTGLGERAERLWLVGALAGVPDQFLAGWSESAAAKRIEQLLRQSVGGKRRT